MRNLESAVNAFVARAEGAFVQNVTLQPDLSRKHGADCERAAQRATINERFQFQFLKIKIDPVKLAARERIAQRLEPDHASHETPVVLVRGARWRALFQRL